MTYRFHTGHVLTTAFAALIAVSTTAMADDFDVSSQLGPNPVLPEPTHSLFPSVHVSKVVGWKDGEAPIVPDGLKIAAYAKDLANPRSVHTLPNGDVLVVQSQGPNLQSVTRPKDLIRGYIMSIAHGSGSGSQKKSNLVTLLRDTNRDGVVDERVDLLTDLNSPFGVAWINDTLYVADTDAVMAYPYKLGDTKIGGPGKVLTPLPGGPIDHHWTKDLALSPDGQTLYAGVGSNSNITENGIEAESGRAAVWAIDRKTGAARIYASGLRNPNGLEFEPDTGDLWVVVNERDELGPNLVPDYMTSVKDGAFYGWPWSYYGQHVDLRVNPQRPDMVAKAIPPDYALTSHVAPLGLVFTKGSAMTASFSDGAFIGEHGSWNRSVYHGYKVVFVPFLNGKPSGKAQDVVTGFLDADGSARGRPVGLGIDGTGALLIADDAGNTVWRVSSGDGSVTPAPVGSDHVQAATAPVPASQPVQTGQPAQMQIAPATLPPAPSDAGATPSK